MEKLEKEKLHNLIVKLLENKYDSDNSEYGLYINFTDLKYSLYVYNEEGKKIKFQLSTNTPLKSLYYMVDDWHDIKEILDLLMSVNENYFNGTYCRHQPFQHDDEFYTGLFKKALKKEQLPIGYDLSIIMNEEKIEIKILEKETNINFIGSFNINETFKKIENVLMPFQFQLSIEDNITSKYIARLMVKIPAYRLSEYSLLNLNYEYNIKKSSRATVDEWLREITNQPSEDKTDLQYYLNNFLLSENLKNKNGDKLDKKNKI